MPRKNKSKKEIVSDIQLVQAADRRRSLVKDVVFPYLIEMNDTVGYSKIFLQAFSGLIEGEFEKTRKSTTIGHLENNIIHRLGEIFKVSDPAQRKEYDRYVKLVENLHDVSVQDLSYALELPRYIDGYMSKKHDKGSITEIDINSILG